MASQIGTKAVLGSWLSTKKGMTYTKYSHLPTDQKVAIQKEYAGRGGKVNEPGPSGVAQEGASTTV